MAFKDILVALTSYPEPTPVSVVDSAVSVAAALGALRLRSRYKIPRAALDPGERPSSGGIEATFIVNAPLQCAHYVLARNHAGEPLVAIDHGHASEAMIDHKLEHPGQLRVSPDIDEFRGHDIRNRSLHQFVITRYHVSRGKDKARQIVELGHQANHLRTFLDGIGIEVVVFEKIAELAQRNTPRYCLDVTRHVVCYDLFDESIQTLPLSGE
jgi:hypothetical protein